MIYITGLLTFQNSWFNQLRYVVTAESLLEAFRLSRVVTFAASITAGATEIYCGWAELEGGQAFMFFLFFHHTYYVLKALHYFDYVPLCIDSGKFVLLRYARLENPGAKQVIAAAVKGGAQLSQASCFRGCFRPLILDGQKFFRGCSVCLICFYSFGFSDCISFHRLELLIRHTWSLALRGRLWTLLFPKPFIKKTCLFFHFTILDSSLRRFDLQGRSILSSALVVLKWRSMSWQVRPKWTPSMWFMPLERNSTKS